jgi:hypothetical protein
MLTAQRLKASVDVRGGPAVALVGEPPPTRDQRGAFGELQSRDRPGL